MSRPSGFDAIHPISTLWRHDSSRACRSFGTAMKWESPVMRDRLLRIRYPVVGLYDQDETAELFFSFGFSTHPRADASLAMSHHSILDGPSLLTHQSMPMPPAFHNLAETTSFYVRHLVLVHGYWSLRTTGILCNWNRRVLTIARLKNAA